MTLFDEDLVAEAIAASTPETVAVPPVELRIVPDHSYVKKLKGSGCAHVLGDGRVCGGARHAFLHNAPSLNTLGVRSGWQAMDTALKAWRAGMAVKLHESGLPRGLDSVLVEGVMTFPTRAKRDQGNHRYFLEKALGDALQKGNVDTRWWQDEPVAGGWLDDDDWSRYEFGNLAFRYERGVRAIDLRIFPNALAR